MIRDVHDQLGDAVQALATARALSEVMQVVRETAREVTRADGVSFVLRDGDRCHDADESAIRPLWKGKRFPMSACISGWVMQNGEAVVLPDVYADSRILQEAYRPTFVKSMAMVPIRNGDAIAAIGAYWAARHVASDEDLRILEVLAEAAGLALNRVS